MCESVNECLTVLTGVRTLMQKLGALLRCPPERAELQLRYAAMSDVIRGSSGFVIAAGINGADIVDVRFGANGTCETLLLWSLKEDSGFEPLIDWKVFRNIETGI